MQSNMGRLKRVEGIRGFASIIVFVHHFAVMFYPAFYWGGIERSHCNGMDIWVGQTPLSFVINGNSGVMIFLTLVGFGTYMVCEKGTKSYAKYIVLRYVKLLLLAIAASAFVLVLFRMNLTFFQDIIGEIYTPWFDNWNPLEVDYLTLLKENPLVSLQKYNNTLWTMQYIFGGSIFCVVLYRVCDNCRNRHLIYLLSVIVLLNMQAIYYLPCVFGFLLADLYCHNPEWKLNNYAGIILLAAGIYMCAYPTGVAPSLAVYSFLPFEYRYYYHMIGAGCIVCAVLFMPFLTRCMEGRIMQFLGKYSMAIYMVHYGVLISFSAWLYSILSDHIGYNRTAVCNLIATSCVVVVASLGLQKIMDLAYRGLNRLYEVLFEKEV